MTPLAKIIVGAVLVILGVAIAGTIGLVFIVLGAILAGVGVAQAI